MKGNNRITDFFAFDFLPLVSMLGFVLIIVLIIADIYEETVITKRCEKLDLPHSCIYEKCIVDSGIGLTYMQKNSYYLQYQTCMMERGMGKWT